MNLCKGYETIRGRSTVNYSKLQLSFILLLIMTVIQLLTALFVLKLFWLVFTSLVAATLCIIGLVYSIKKESSTKNKKH